MTAILLAAARSRACPRPSGVDASPAPRPMRSQARIEAVAREAAERRRRGRRRRAGHRRFAAGAPPPSRRRARASAARRPRAARRRTRAVRRGGRRRVASRARAAARARPAGCCAPNRRRRPQVAAQPPVRVARALLTAGPRTVVRAAPRTSTPVTGWAASQPASRSSPTPGSRRARPASYRGDGSAVLDVSAARLAPRRRGPRRDVGAAGIVSRSPSCSPDGVSPDGSSAA